MGESINFLFMEAPTTSIQDDGSGQDADERSRTQDKRMEKNYDSTTDVWELDDFSGTGEYVDVEATIDAIFFIKKDASGIPDVKGEFTDESVFRPVTFIVEDGVGHPYLDEGTTFLFENVKDQYYKKEGEIQVVINRNTSFTESS